MNNPRMNPLYGEIKKAMEFVKDAEANYKAWKEEAADRMKKVNTLIRAAKTVDPSIDRAAYLEALAEDFATASETPIESTEPAAETVNDIT